MERGADGRMANRKKHSATNPERDRVKEIFRQNIQIAKKLRRDGYFDTMAMYDLSEKYCTRRVEAVTRLIPEMRKRYVEQYPDMDIAEEFAEIASTLNTTYDELDACFLLCQGAAIWMLDQIVESAGTVELCRLLSEFDNTIDIPEVYDTRYAPNLITKMICMLLCRYGEDDKNVIPSSYFTRQDENSIFDEILTLIPENAKSTAAENLQRKYWEWADLYFEALYPVVQSNNALHKRMERFENELKELTARNLSRRAQNTALSLLLPEKVFNDDVYRRQEEILRIENRMEELTEAAGNMSDQLHEYRYSSVQIDMMDRQSVLEYMAPEIVDKMLAFPIEDPYEICFALLYLLNQDDDCVWSYSFMLAVVSRAVAMLPWSGAVFNESNDGYWYNNDEKIPPQPLDSEWYERKYIGDRDATGRRDDVNLAQLVYQYTGVIVPRNTRRYDGAAKKLRKNGLKPSQASMLCAVMNILGEASRQQKYLPDGTTAETSPIEPAAAEQSAEENAQLKRELTQLKAQMKKINHDLSQENAILQDKLFKAEKASAAMAQELTDLREIVFNQQRSVPQEKEEPAKIAFPYRTDRRVIAFGGHDSWLREIKFKVPDVRFMGEDISSAEVIRRADVVWIQTNCIGHNTYYNVIDLVRRYGRKVRYFKYASAVKCAEQVAEEEEKSKA
jgi:hypothetical protein